MHTELGLTLGLLYSFLLVLARVSGAFAFVPLPGWNHTPEMARIVLSLGFTVALFPVWPAAPSTAPGIGQLLVWLVSEGALGMGVGLAIAFLAEGFLLASQVFGLQAGYSYASTIDPNSQADTGILQVLSQLMASMLFFTCGMDRQVIRAFAQSFETCPPGTSWVSFSRAEAILQLGAGMFTLGLRLALPIIALLILIDISLALLGRINAQLQLLTLAFPVKMLTALAVLAALAGAFPVLYQGAAERTVLALSDFLRKS